MLSRHRLIWQALAIAALCASIPVSIKYFDRPIATFFEFHFVDVQGLGRFAALPGWLLVPALLMPFAILVSRPLSASKAMRAALISGSSVIWTSAVVEIVMKRFFGRLQTSSWIVQHTYGFHLFAGIDQQFRSFPSGEAAILSAVICTLWPMYARLRGLLALLAIVETFLILSLNWHFLSDVIAGALVGAISSIISRVSMERLSGPHRIET